MRATAVPETTTLTPASPKVASLSMIAKVLTKSGQSDHNLGRASSISGEAIATKMRANEPVGAVRFRDGALCCPTVDERPGDPPNEISTTV